MHENYCNQCGKFFRRAYAANFCSHLCTNRFNAANGKNCKNKDKENQRLFQEGLRRCTKCKQIWPANSEYFYRDKRHKTGLGSVCKDCVHEHGKNTGKINGKYEELQDLFMAGLSKCAKCGRILELKQFGKEKKKSRNVQSRCKDCISKNKKKAENKQKRNEEHRKRMQDPEYKEKHGQKRRDYEKNRCEKDIEFKLRRNVRSLMHNAIKRLDKNGKSWQNLTGYSAERLRKNIQGKMKKGMNWKNYGKEWHIDHKIPISKWGITSVHDLAFKKCWALENLQPMWKEENFRKSNKLTQPHQQVLPIKLEG